LEEGGGDESGRHGDGFGESVDGGVAEGEGVEKAPLQVVELDVPRRGGRAGCGSEVEGQGAEIEIEFVEDVRDRADELRALLDEAVAALGGGPVDGAGHREDGAPLLESAVRGDQ